MTPTVERFWIKVSMRGGIAAHMDTECWVWRAGKYHGTGYGRFWNGTKYTGAHQYALATSDHPQTPDKPCALHRCDNRLCVRPDHLFAGTLGENIRDMFRKHRSRWGDQRERDAKICSIRAAGFGSQSELAAMFSLTQSQVSVILARGAPFG